METRVDNVSSDNQMHESQSLFANFCQTLLCIFSVKWTLYTAQRIFTRLSSVACLRKPNAYHLMLWCRTNAKSLLKWLKINNSAGDKQLIWQNPRLVRLSIEAGQTTELVTSLQRSRPIVVIYYPVTDTSGDEVLFSIDFFVSLLARLRENGWTDLREIFREGVEWPRDDLITFLVNSEKPRDAAMRNTEAGFVVRASASQLVDFVTVPFKQSYTETAL